MPLISTMNSFNSYTDIEELNAKLIDIEKLNEKFDIINNFTANGFNSFDCETHSILTSRNSAIETILSEKVKNRPAM